MATTAVLRVKRKRDADPAEMLVLTCKRFRRDTQVDFAELVPSVMERTLFKLAGTVSSQSELFQKCVHEAICRDKRAETLRPSLASNQRIHQDLRVSKQTHRQESRYRLITSRRPSYGDDLAQYSPSEIASAESTKSDSTTDTENLDTEGSSSAEGNSENHDTFQLFDIIQEEVDADRSDSAGDSAGKSDDPDVILCNSVRLLREKLAVSESGQGVQHREKDDYVYDIYYMDAPTQGWIQDILSVKPYSQEYELVGEDHKSEEIYEDEDDENEENNWRNEYPDEDELLFEENEEENSDEDEGYKDYSSDEENIRGSSWKKYCKNVLHEFGYDETRDLDSD